jgi:hypothetical protein
MASVELTTEQIASLVRQLPVERKREVLMALAGDSQSGRSKRMTYAEQQLRKLCAERGLDWDAMSDSEREAFVDDVLHEDRPCAK